MTDVAPGLSAAHMHDVGAADTAIALGSGDLPVLATPRLIAWLEAAAVAAVSGRLDAGSTTVGSHVAVDHLAPTAVGAAVLVEAVVTSVDGPRIEFALSAVESEHVIGRGVHVRYVVDADRFMGRRPE